MESTTLTARDALLDAAAALLLTHGFDAVSMERVRLSAGVSNGCLFHHFPTKAHLARGVYARVLEDFQRTVVAPLTRAVSARVGVESMVRRYIDWVVGAPKRARLLIDLRAFTTVPGMSTAWDDPNRRAFADMRVWIDRHVDAGTMRALPFDVWLAFVIAPALHLTYQWVRQPAPQVHRSVRQALAQAAWRSVAAQPEDAA